VHLFKIRFRIFEYKAGIMSEKQVTPAPILLRYGGAKKSTFDMNAEELAEAALSILRRAKEKAFSKGLPIHYSKDGILMAEYPDGRIEPVKKN
jgi:hypothetical protein